MKTILAILALCLCLGASTAQIMWTAYTSAVQNTTCDPQNTNFYDVLNLATDSQGRAWQFGGRGKISLQITNLLNHLLKIG
jgi:hypothetical protein